jgi:hypothetical protein
MKIKKLYALLLSLATFLIFGGQSDRLVTL